MSYRGLSPVSSYQQSPEQAVRWIPVTSTGMTCSLLCAQEIFRPSGVVGGAGDLVHQLLGGNALQVSRRGAVAQRLHSIVDRLHSRLEGLVALQGYAHAFAGEIGAVAEGRAAA